MRPAWWVLFTRELRDLWIGGKALYLILFYTVLLGAYSYLLASNAEVQLLPRNEMVLETVKASIGVCLFISLLIGADSISGERERATFEALLLTPASRRQIITGKLLAAVSPWPIALVISIPYWSVLSKGDPVFGQALIWGILLGTLLAPAVAGLGMLVSLFCNTNKSSMLVSLGVFLLIFVPTELARPGRTATAGEVRRALILVWTNPWDAAAAFLGDVLALGTRPVDVWYKLVLPTAFPIIVLALLFTYGSRGFQLESGATQWLQSVWRRWTARGPLSLLKPRPQA
jgi:ABC-2 type transport system permease protein